MMRARALRSEIFTRAYRRQRLENASPTSTSSDNAMRASRAPEGSGPQEHADLAVPRLASNGLEAWTQVLQCGHEGYVAKDEESKYVGGRTRAWLKVKQKDWTLADDRWRRRIRASRTT